MHKAQVKSEPISIAGSASQGKPDLSVLLITYNHGKYIGQAIESILAQQTKYSIVIHVIEDCSTDNTQEVVMRYVEKYPDRVIPFFNKKNIGFKVTQKNFIRGLRTMNGKYWAVLEGDDYWSSPHKIEKQIDFLEANADFVACGHNTIKIYEDGSKEPHRFLYWDNTPEVHTIEGLIMIESFFHASSLVYRNVYQGNPPDYFSNPWSCDIFINIAHAQWGKYRYFNEDMSVYRAHAGGRFSNMKLPDGWIFNIDGLRRYNEWLRYRYLKTFSRSIARYCSVLLRGAGRDGAGPLSLPLRLKYMALRAMYLMMYYAIEIPQRSWRYSQKLLPQRLRGNILMSVGLFAVLFVPITVLSLFLLAIKFVLSSTKNLAMAAIPDSTRSRLLEIEQQFPNFRHFRYMVFHGNPLSQNGLQALKNLLKSTIRECMKLPYRFAARLTPEFIKRRIKALEERYEILRYYRQLISNGQLFSSEGRRVTIRLLRAVAMAPLRWLNPRKVAAEACRMALRLTPSFIKRGIKSVISAPRPIIRNQDIGETKGGISGVRAHSAGMAANPTRLDGA